MGFYEEFSSYYDSIFPLKNDKVEFLNKHFSEYKGKQILDIGTGTGSYALALAEHGFKITGIDLDNKMIDLAGDKINNPNLSVEFKCLDMMEIDDYFNYNTFSGIYIIGNVLVHLESRKVISQFINNLNQILKKDGVVIIQIINYDRIIDQHIDGLPTINNKNEGVSLVRKYQLTGEKNRYIDFNTELTINRTDNQLKYHNTTKLIPLRSAELNNILRDAGFNNIKQYGDFKGNPFELDHSVPYIVVAKQTI